MSETLFFLLINCVDRIVVLLGRNVASPLIDVVGDGLFCPSPYHYIFKRDLNTVTVTVCIALATDHFMCFTSNEKALKSIVNVSNVK